MKLSGTASVLLGVAAAALGVGSYVGTQVERLEEHSRTVLGEIRQLAVEQFGTDDSTGISRVVETALALRLEWLRRVGEPATLVEEPVIDWSSESSAEPTDEERGISRWLFREKE